MDSTVSTASRLAAASVAPVTTKVFKKSLMLKVEVAPEEATPVDDDYFALIVWSLTSVTIKDYHASIFRSNRTEG